MSARSVVFALALSFTASAAFAQTPVELKAGDAAPDFSLPATDGKTYKLSDFKGKSAVVIAWFPKAFTQGCTIECKSLAEKGHLIKGYQAGYFMASVDPLDENTKFGAEYKADFPLLSDPAKKTAEAYGVLNARGVANRWTFYIGKDGKIQHIDKAVKPSTTTDLARSNGAARSALPSTATRDLSAASDNPL